MALPKSDAQRIAKYLAKTVPTTVGLKIAGQLADMKTGFANAIGGSSGLVDMLMLVQTELATLTAIPPISYGQYYAFAEECWKLLRTTSQPAADTAAQIIHDKWEARGATSAALIQIATNVFNITVT